MITKNITAKDFKKALNEFGRKDKRARIWEKCLDMCKNESDPYNKAHAITYLLATWNFASFKYVIKNWDMNNLNNTLKKVENKIEKIKETVREREFYEIKENELLELRKSIEESYWILVENLAFDTKYYQYVGATKALSLILPNLFVMWDNKIRKEYNKSRWNYGINKSLILNNEKSKESYFNFLLLMHKIFIKRDIIDVYEEIKSRRRQFYTFAKAIDEYNYVRITLKGGRDE